MVDISIPKVSQNLPTYLSAKCSVKRKTPEERRENNNKKTEARRKRKKGRVLKMITEFVISSNFPCMSVLKLVVIGHLQKRKLRSFISS